MLLTKICTGCGRRKPLTEFGPDKRHSDGRQSRCRDCCNKRKQYLKQHPLPPKEVLPEGFKRCSVCKKIKPLKEFCRDKYKKDGWKSQCKDCCSHWRRESPKKTHIRDVRSRNRRRALKAGAEGSHTHAEFALLCKRVGEKCLCCGRSHDDSPLTEDHIQPLSKGGSNEILNIQPLCGHCNDSKGVKNTNYWQDPWWACCA